MKLTSQVKLQPLSEQADALLRTLELANAAANRLSQLAWDTGEFNKFALQTLFYRQIREEFPLSAQVVIRIISKVADAYKLDRKVQRVFRSHGGIAYDLRILSWKPPTQVVSIWTVEGRQSIAYVGGQSQLELLQAKRGESDLVFRDGEWFLFTTVDVPNQKEHKVLDWIGVDMGIVSIAQTSAGQRFSGAHVNSRRARNARLRQKLQSKGTRSAKRLLRRRRRKEQRFSRDVNHQISKKIVDVAQRTECGIAMEDLNGIRSRVRARKKQRRSLHSWSFGQLQSFISYKAARVGVPVAFVDPRNTSRTCSECGCVNKRNRKTQSEFVCINCGHADNADFSASCEISRRATVN